jgi:hypothetical protein
MTVAADVGQGGRPRADDRMRGLRPDTSTARPIPRPGRPVETLGVTRDGIAEFAGTADWESDRLEPGRSHESLVSVQGACAGGDGARGVSEPASDSTDGAGDWLADCRGFRVEAGSGLLGVVDEVVREPESGRPHALVLRTGPLGSRRLDVGVDHVAGVVPGRRLVVVSTDAPS